MGESTSPQRIQLEEMVLKDKNDGKAVEADNGLQVGLLFLPVTRGYSNSRIPSARIYKTKVNVGHSDLFLN